MNQYTRGQLVRIDVTVTDRATLPVDPAQTLAQFYGADNVLHLPAVTRDGLGLYHYFVDTYLLPVVASQICRRRFSSPDGDPAQCVKEGAFQVVAPGLFTP